MPAETADFSSDISRHPHVFMRTSWANQTIPHEFPGPHQRPELMGHIAAFRSEETFRGHWPKIYSPEGEAAGVLACRNAQRGGRDCLRSTVRKVHSSSYPYPHPRKAIKFLSEDLSLNPISSWPWHGKWLNKYLKRCAEPSS